MNSFITSVFSNAFKIQRKKSFTHTVSDSYHCFENFSPSTTTKDHFTIKILKSSIFRSLFRFYLL